MKNVLVVCTLVLLGFLVGKFSSSRPGESMVMQPTTYAGEVAKTTVNPAQSVPGPEIVNKEAADDVIPELSQDQLDPLVADFVATGNPQQVMDFFKQRRTARAELLQRKMSQENLDERWSRELQDQYLNAKTLLPGMDKLDLNNADCRESICALELTYIGGSQYRDVQPLMSNIGNVLGADAFVHYDALPDTAIVYVSRGETRLPGLEKAVDG